MHQQQTVFGNIVGNGEIACNEQFLLFPQCFLLNQIIVSPFLHIFDIISLFAAEMEEPKIIISGKGLTLCHAIQLFNDPKRKGFERLIDCIVFNAIFNDISMLSWSSLYQYSAQYSFQATDCFPT